MEKNASRWIPYLALAVSIVAVALSVWSAWETRRYNRLSVTPAVHIRADSKGTFALINNGIGPARLEEVRFYYEGELSRPNRQFFEKITNDLNPPKDANVRWDILIGKNIHIAPGQERILYGFMTDNLPTPEAVHALNGTILSCSALLSDAQANFGTFVQYVFHQMPQTMPDFLPEDWPNRSTRSPRPGEAG